MQNKGIVIGVSAVVVAVAFALVFYMMSGSTSSTAGTGSGSVASSSSPGYADQSVNRSALIEEIKARLVEDPDNPDLLIRLGDAYFSQRRFNEAAKYYKKCVEVAADNPDVYNNLGLTLHYLGDSAEGLRYIDQGIEKDPYLQRIWLTKGFILASGMGNLEGAKSAWEKARAMDPDSQVGKAASEYLAQIDAQLDNAK